MNDPQNAIGRKEERPLLKSLRPREKGNEDESQGKRNSETRRESQIKHRIFNLASGTSVPHLLSLPVCSQLLFLLTRRTTCSSPTTVRYALQKPMQVRASTFACKIGIVRGSGERDGLGRTSKHVRDRIGKSLEPVRIEPDIIEDDVIVCGTDCALKTVVSLKEEIKV